MLSDVPLSPDWDEASLGYNAYSILKSGKDEYGQTLPIVLKSFGDYKPALYAYLVVPFIAVFDLNLLSVRMPSAILGIISVISVYFLCLKLFKNQKVALLSSFFLAISPWHIQFSRPAFEANLGLTLIILFVWFFLEGLRKPYFLIVSAFFASLSLYAYQSEKLFTPMLAIILLLIFKKEFFLTGKKYLSLAFIAGIIVALPMLFFVITNKEAFSRAASTSIFAKNGDLYLREAERYRIDLIEKDYIGLVFDNPKVFYLKTITSNYLSHFNLNWLFIKGDLPRHHAPYMGLLYLFELPLLLLGLYSLVFSKSIEKKTKLLIFSWFLITPIPASITSDVPHAIRTLSFLPTYQIFAALGVLNVYRIIKENMNINYIRNIAYGLIILFITINSLYYLNQYFVQQNYFNAKEWQYGYEELVNFLEKEKDSYKKVVVSDQVPMDQSYIFFLFYTKYDPNIYQKKSNQSRNFEKYVFKKIENSDFEEEGSLIVGSGENRYDNLSLVRSFDYPNGDLSFWIANSNK